MVWSPDLHCINDRSVHWPEILWHYLTINNSAFLLLILEIPSEKFQSESQEQKTETACRSHGMREQNGDQVDPTTQTNARQAADGKVSTPKIGSKTSRKTGKKLSICVFSKFRSNFH